MLYAKISQNGMGLTNQIITFVYSIIKTIKSKNHKVVVIDFFLIDYSRMDYTPVSDIINLKELNVYLLQKYNVIVVDKYNSNWELVNVYYGIDTNKIEITEEIKNTFLQGDRLFINKYTDFNRIRGDPCFGKEKTLFLNYEINIRAPTSTFSEATKYIIEEPYNELLNDHILVDISNAEYNLEFIDLYLALNDSAIFEDILNKIVYSSVFYQLAAKMTERIFNLRNSYFVSTPLRLVNPRTPTATRPVVFAEVKQKVNVIHLRVEPDAIVHWSKMNKMEPDVFKTHIEAKYIELIKKYMNKMDTIIVLSNSIINNVTEFLLKNNYNIFITDKYFEHREQNALVDLLVSKRCNNVFIGCFNNKLKIGSTFSYYITRMVDPSVMKVGIDIDSIKEPEHIFY